MSQPISAAQRVLDILLSFNSATLIQSPEALSGQIGLPRSTTYRYISLLCDKGFLEKASPGMYQLGPQCLRLGQIAAVRRELASIIHPYMEHIAQETGETVLLTRVSGNQSICIDRIEAQHSIRITFEIGHAQSLHAGASSKVLLAYFDAARQNEILSQPLQQFTNQTVIERQALEQQLKDIRERGYCVTESEVDLGAKAIAVPILDRKGRILAALSTAGPAFRITDDLVEQHIALLHQQRQHIEDYLSTIGY